MTQKIKTFLMFDGRCEEAMTFYVSLFRDAAVTNIRRCGPGGAGAEGSVMQASFTVNGQTFMCLDSPAKRGFTFTPAMSLFVDCADEAEFSSPAASHGRKNRDGDRSDAGAEARASIQVY